MSYPFDLLDHPNARNGHELLSQRNQSHRRNLRRDAIRFDPDEALKTAIHTAIAIGEPLLLTGDTGTGKTQTAYYVAQMLGLGEVLEFHVKSNSSAQDVLYRFDHVRYYREAGSKDAPTDTNAIKWKAVSKGVLWQALESATTRVVLIDEIDKAPRDFPNDLLHELDQMEFTVPELDDLKIGGDSSHRPLVFITSNNERRLPDAFLRRCVFHHIEFNEALLRRAIQAHREDFQGKLSQGFIDLAVNRFMDLREKHLRRKSATGEFLAWLRVMAMLAETSEGKLQKALIAAEDDLTKLPYLGVLLKDRQDMERLKEYS
ncbi:MoxR family ATPase [Candidatus Thiothrix sp. Deng01]|uniref:MoxR family ATPase n=1 Tax=Candidatus Thiothrix phosphatis TaxID=3112415 RepID=A0ABU6CT02_9GAMM|nr:MoxR family ATPase [Candidatus Thiothrix sp. Deng01]MEB4589962.1 MoxR family ATPase [Candidatus Thiothrix sp. Deng01]